jgi:hypothetical protein
MLDALLANLLSAVKDDNPRANETAPAVATATERPAAPALAQAGGKVPNASAERAVAGPLEHSSTASRVKRADPPQPARVPAPLVVKVPHEAPAPKAASSPPHPAPKPKAQEIVWQLYCAADGKLYYHADKAYLERFVAERNALYANAQRALEMAPPAVSRVEPRIFFNPAPGFGYQAGAACFGGS